ncbi:MAG: hypothetical protein Q4F79_04510 [Eubacteriales bacterium]|nr:hypothetical protein [Eubacteriales bacterium]
MAVNLATKYSSQIAEVFTAGSFVKGKTSTSFDLTGVKTLKVYTPITVPEVDYTREGMGRYGTVTEMQDVVQELKMTQDKAFTLIIISILLIINLKPPFNFQTLSIDVNCVDKTLNNRSNCVKIPGFQYTFK